MGAFTFNHREACFTGSVSEQQRRSSRFLAHTANHPHSVELKMEIHSVGLNEPVVFQLGADRTCTSSITPGARKHVIRKCLQRRQDLKDRHVPI